MKKSMMALLAIVMLSITINCSAFTCAGPCEFGSQCYVPGGMTKEIPCEDRYLVNCEPNNMLPYNFGRTCKAGYEDLDGDGWNEITEDGYCVTKCGVKTCWGVTCLTDLWSHFSTCYIWPISGQEQ